MDVKKIVLLVGALIIAAVTAFMAKSMFSGAGAPQAEAQQAPAGPEVLVATRTLPVGTSRRRGLPLQDLPQAVQPLFHSRLRLGDRAR